VHILIKEPGLTTISLQTINGKKVRERLFPAIGPGSYNLEFDTAELPAGIYILTVITGPTTSSQTIQIL
jgi:hypothetical protein